MYRNFFSVGALTALSRLTGFLREIVIGALMGQSALADAYFVALRLPNQFRAIFGEGAFNSAYVPSYSRVLVDGGRRARDRFREPHPRVSGDQPDRAARARLFRHAAVRRTDRARLRRRSGQIRPRGRHDAHHLSLSRLHHHHDAAIGHAERARLFRGRRLRAGAAQPVHHRLSRHRVPVSRTPASRRAGAWSLSGVAQLAAADRRILAARRAGADRLAAHRRRRRAILSRARPGGDRLGRTADRDPRRHDPRLRHADRRRSPRSTTPTGSTNCRSA